MSKYLKYLTFRNSVYVTGVGGLFLVAAIPMDQFNRRDWLPFALTVFFGGLVLAAMTGVLALLDKFGKP